MSTIEAMIRPDIRELEAYAPIVPLEVLAERLGLPLESLVKLDANENPYGPSPRVLEALGRYPHYAVYPDPDHMRLRRAISGYIGQPVERILCGHGSDEIIDLLMRLFIQPGDAVIEATPTFGMYSFDTGLAGGRLVQVPRDEEFRVDIEGIAEAVESTGAKLIFLPSPNNPTGTPLARHEVLRLLELPALLVVDEAYAEFSGESVADLAGQHPNLVVLRTFSKWAGLAGLRVGYGLIPEPIITHLWKIKQPYNVNVAAEVAALASLEDVETLRRSVALIVAERERVLAELRAIDGLAPFPSQANFILFRLLRGDAAAVKRELERQGILLRYYRKPPIADCLRISIGRPEQNDRALTALREALARS